MSFTSINLGLQELLRDPLRRKEFFKAITQDEVAAQIRALRKKRNLTQTEFAREADMKQSAVSRIEQAEYSSWSLTTLFRVADALNARWRIILQPVEEAVQELEKMEKDAGLEDAAISGAMEKPPLPDAAKSAAQESQRRSMREPDASKAYDRIPDPMQFFEPKPRRPHLPGINDSSRPL